MASDLRKFIIAELRRFEVFRDWRMMAPKDGESAAARNVYRDFFESRGKDSEQLRTQISRTIAAALEAEELPTPAKLRAIWLDLYPPPATASTACEHCRGTGFEIIERDGNSGARRCRCGGVAVADSHARHGSAQGVA